MNLPLQRIAFQGLRLVAGCRGLEADLTPPRQPENVQAMAQGRKAFWRVEVFLEGVKYKPSGDRVLREGSLCTLWGGGRKWDFACLLGW